MRAGVGWSAREATALLERFTGRGTTVVLPEDRAACDKALVHGRTLAECVPASPLRMGVRALAADLAGLPAPRTGRRQRVRAVP
jgi:hypothetical protein